MGNLISTISGILVVHHVSSIYDPDALAFFNAVEGAGGVLTLTEKSATNQLVIDFKSNGTWTKKLAIYPMVGGSAISQSFNLKDPSLYRLTYNGAVTHSAAGMKFNAASGSYADTHLTDVLWNVNNVHLSVWNTEDIDANTVETGLWLSGGRIFLQTKSSGSIVGCYASYSVASVPSAVGMSTVDYSPSLLQVYKNGGVLVSSTQPSVGPVNRSITLGGLTDGTTTIQFPSNKMFGYAEYGRSQTGTETLNDYYFVQTFQGSLSRNLGARMLLVITLLLSFGIVLTSQQTYDLNLLLESLPAPAPGLAGAEPILSPAVKEFLQSEGYNLNI